MSDNQANPLKEAETDVQKAQKAISGLLNPLNPKEEETIGQQTPPKEDEKQNSSEPTQEESQEDQPQDQEISEETESQEEVSEQEVSQDEEQIDTQEKQDSPLHKVKVNGQEFEVTLDELRNGYSRDADYRRKTEELSYEKKQFMSESEKQRQDYSARLNEASQMLSLAQQQLNADINSADLEKLYEEDPTEAARIEHRLRKKQEKINSAVAKNQSEQKKQFDSFLKDQQIKLVTKMPEFNDPDKASKLKSSMKSTLNFYGFNDQELSLIHI